MSLRNIDFGNLGNILPAISLIIYALTHKEIPLDVNELAVYLLLLILGIVLAYSLWFTTMTLSIWLTNVQGMHELFLGAMTLLRYPASVYKGLGKIIFMMVFPIVLVSNVPVNSFLNNLSDVKIFLIYTFSYFCFSVIFWKVALRYYQSASS